MGIFDALKSAFSRGGGEFPTVTIGADFWENSVEVSNNIDQLARALRDMTNPMLQSLYDVVIPAIKENFAAEGRPKWPQLASITVEIRGNAHPILRRTGALYQAATNPSNFQVTKTSLTQTKIPIYYGVYHMTGTSVMPARPFTTLTPEDHAKIGKIFEVWVAEQIEKKGKFRRQ